MSNFAKKGLRANKHKINKNIDSGVKSWMTKYHTMVELGKTILQNHPDIEIDKLDEDNINTYAKPLFGRDLDNMEKLLVLGTINDYNE